jgi:hypothetical protein
VAQLAQAGFVRIKKNGAIVMLSAKREVEALGRRQRSESLPPKS